MLKPAKVHAVSIVWGCVFVKPEQDAVSSPSWDSTQKTQPGVSDAS